VYCFSEFADYLKMNEQKLYFFWIFLLWVIFLSSCMGLPKQNPPVQGLPAQNPPVLSPPPENPPAHALPPENPPVLGLPLQKPPERPEPSENIMGKGMVTREKLTLFLRLNNPEAKPDFVQMLAGTYIEEAADEGVNHDVAFAQMCLETGYLKYGGLVLPEWNNFCGLGAIGPQQPGEVFPDPLTGVRAHIQHLKAYASEEPLKGELVDPRYKWVRKGSSPGIEGLSGNWAVDKAYSGKIRAILRRLYIFSFT
jgi:hypothetical protein